MTTDITIIESKYHGHRDDFSQDDVDSLMRANELLENEVKRLRKDKERLHEQLTLLKKFSDGLWDGMKVNI